jgi:hypothetical protein
MRTRGPGVLLLLLELELLLLLLLLLLLQLKGWRSQRDWVVSGFRRMVVLVGDTLIFLAYFGGAATVCIARCGDAARWANSTRWMLVKSSTGFIIGRFLGRSAIRFPFTEPLHCGRRPVMIVAWHAIRKLMCWRRGRSARCHR